MVIYGVALSTLQSIAEKVDMKLTTMHGGEPVQVRHRQYGIGYRLVLRPTSEMYRDYSPHGRRKNAITYHGHGVFMAHVFGENALARVESWKAVYNGRGDFHMQTRYAFE